MKNKKDHHIIIIISAFLAIALAIVSILTTKNILASDNVITTDTFLIDKEEETRTTSDATQEEIELKEEQKELEEEQRELEAEQKELEAESFQTDITVDSSLEESDDIVDQLNEKYDQEEEEEDDDQEEDSDLKPVFKFRLKSVVMEGRVEVKGTVEGAEKVEFYLVRKGSVEPNIYLGEADQRADIDWLLVYDFSNTPNSDYSLYARIKNKYGTYSSDQITISVKNREDENSEPLDVENPGTVTSDQGKIDNLNQIQKETLNNSNLTIEEKKRKIEELIARKEEIKRNFAFRKRAEELLSDKEQRELTEEKKAQLREIKEKLGLDSDGDGLPDHEEERIGTNILSADTDQDGYLDGDEVRNGYNPLKAASESEKGVDKIVFDEPRNSGVENDFYQIEKVGYKGSSGSSEKKEIEIKGRALPNSFITLYIYSEPIVVTVKTDEDGNWSYILDKELEDGEHQVYSAVTDNTGKITFKSKAFGFVKTAQAITFEKQNSENLDQIKSPMEDQKNRIIIFVIIISVSSLIFGLISILLLIRNHRKTEM